METNLGQKAMKCKQFQCILKSRSENHETPFKDTNSIEHVERTT